MSVHRGHDFMCRKSLQLHTHTHTHTQNLHRKLHNTKSTCKYLSMHEQWPFQKGK